MLLVQIIPSICVILLQFALLPPAAGSGGSRTPQHSGSRSRSESPYAGQSLRSPGGGFNIGDYDLNSSPSHYDFDSPRKSRSRSPSIGPAESSSSSSVGGGGGHVRTPSRSPSQPRTIEASHEASSSRSKRTSFGTLPTSQEVGKRKQEKWDSNVRFFKDQRHELKQLRNFAEANKFKTDVPEKMHGLLKDNKADKHFAEGKAQHYKDVAEGAKKLDMGKYERRIKRQRVDSPSSHPATKAPRHASDSDGSMRSSSRSRSTSPSTSY